MLSLKLGLFTSYQQVFIKHIVYHLFFLVIPVGILLVQFPLWFWMIYSIFINLTYLRAVSTEYFLLSITCCLLALISECFIFSCQTTSSLLSLTSLYIFFAISQLLYNFLRKVCSFSNSIFIVRSLFHEYLLKLSLNGVYIIAKYLLSLY